MAYWEEHWDARGRAGSAGVRDRYLDPGYPPPYGTSSLTRTRSVGHTPAPNVQVYNYNTSDIDARSPSPARYGRGRSPARVQDDALIDEVEALRQDIRRQSRSPGRYRDPSPNYYQQWQLDHMARDAEDRLNWERAQGRRQMELQRLQDRIGREEEASRLKSVEEQMRWRMEKERLKAEAKAQQEKIDEEQLKEKILRDKEAADRKAKEERDRAIKDWERKQDEEEKERKEAQKRAVEAFERKKREEQEEQKRAVEAYERKMREEKDEKERLKLKFKMEEEEAKREEERKEKEWEMKQKMKEEKEKAKKKAEEEELEEEMRKRLGKFGFQDNQIQAMLDPKKADQLKVTYGQTPSTALTIGSKPTYIKIHKDHLAVETLKYYRIPYEVDHDYVIILQEMSNAETDILFEHTRRLRKPAQLFIEDRSRGRDPQYAWVRKPARSKSRSRSRQPAGALFGFMS